MAHAARGVRLISHTYTIVPGNGSNGRSTVLHSLSSRVRRLLRHTTSQDYSTITQQARSGGAAMEPMGTDGVRVNRDAGCLPPPGRAGKGVDSMA